MEEADSAAAQQAKQMGLVSKGWGRWADPSSGQVTHKTEKGQLVPVSGGGAKTTAGAGKVQVTPDEFWKSAQGHPPSKKSTPQAPTKEPSGLDEPNPFDPQQSWKSVAGTGNDSEGANQAEWDYTDKLAQKYPELAQSDELETYASDTLARGIGGREFKAEMDKWVQQNVGGGQGDTGINLADWPKGTKTTTSELEPGREFIDKDSLETVVSRDKYGSSKTTSPEQWEAQKMLRKPENWRLVSPEEHLGRAYWQRGQMPPQEPEKRKAAWEKIKAHLEKKYPESTTDTVPGGERTTTQTPGGTLRKTKVTDRGAYDQGVIDRAKKAAQSLGIGR